MYAMMYSKFYITLRLTLGTVRVRMRRGGAHGFVTMTLF